jgi:ribosomal protein S18 acetylase RimI-like enzyme
MTTTKSITATIRPAQTSDIKTIGAMGGQLMALHHRWDPVRFIPPTEKTNAAYSHWLRRQLSKREVVIMVAAENSTILGYVYAAIEGYDYMALRGPAGVIHDIFVDPDRRCEGHGSALLQAAIMQLGRLGTDQIILSTASANEAGQRLFSSVGFRPTMIEMSRTLPR